MSEKNYYSETYKKIFLNYLRFSRFTCRDLLDTKELFELLQKLEIPQFGFSKFENFQIYIEFLSAVNIIKPFCVFIKEIQKGLRIKERMNRNILQSAYKDKKIIFSSIIYGTKNIKDNQDLIWDWNQFNFFWHPIQIFQIISHYRYVSLHKLHRLKDYQNFLLNHFPDKKYKFQDQSFSHHPLLSTYFYTSHWLTEEILNLWIKIENIFSGDLIGKSAFNINCHFMIDFFSDRIILNKFFTKSKKWQESWEKRIYLLLNSQEINIFRKFMKDINWNISRRSYYGLENYVDLFSQINYDKLEHLKGYLWLWVNLIQVYKTLSQVDFYLAKYNKDYVQIQQNLTNPQVFFHSKDEYFSQIKDLLLSYSLLPQSNICIYFEGKTERILLTYWKDIVFSRFQIDIGLFNLKSKNAQKYFKKNFEELKGIDHFLLLDQDTEKYVESKDAEWKNKIPKENYKIFCPDLVTENFSIEEILSVFAQYVEKENKKETDLERIYQFDKDEKAILKNQLVNREKTGKMSKYENILEDFYASSFGGSFNKLDFAESLKEYIFESPNSSVETIAQYEFIKILNNFIDRIRFRKYPKIIEEMKKSE